MTTIQVSQRLPYRADVVWSLIGDFGGLHRWHPQVCRLDLSWEGRIRTLHYVDGLRMVERLEARNDPACRYVYALVDGSLPLDTCRSALEVVADGEQCQVNWLSDFETVGNAAVEVESFLQRLYQSGLAALAIALGNI